MAQRKAQPPAAGQTSEPTSDQSGNGSDRPWRVAAARPVQGAAGLEWLANRRAAALARLEISGLPDRSEEDWRYTSLASYTERWTGYLAVAGQLLPPEAGGAVPASGSPDVPAFLPVLVIDGTLPTPPVEIPQGLTIRSLRTLAPEWRGRVEALLHQTDASAPESLVDLNTALLSDIILIATEPGARIGKTVHVRVQSTAARTLCLPRLLVDLAPGSRLSLCLEFTGTAGALVNAVTQVSLAPQSQLQFVRLQALPDDGMLTETTRIEIAELASVTVTSVDLGSQLSRQGLTVLLAGADASAAVHGLFLADGHRHIDNHTRLEHQALRTTSRETFRGIAADHGHGVFNGKVIVQPGAAGSNAALTNRNLLLTTTAEIDTKPELEIYVDDVRCSHGATTGQLDADALFYLRSRGLDPAAARQLLTAAFLREGLNGIAVSELQASIDARLQARLQSATGAGP